MAMNGWGAPEPAWWLNLQAHPEAVVELAGGIRRDVLGRAAMGVEHERLWQRWRADWTTALLGAREKRRSSSSSRARRPNDPRGGHEIGSGVRLGSSGG
jgi:hypothetical protein